MSPRAAWWLEHLGFGRSVDYAGGKMDWLSFDLPWDGTAQFVSRNVDRDAPTCRIDDKIGEARARVSSPGLCVVVNESGVVAGSLSEGDLHADNEALVKTVMDSAPATVRLTEEVPALEERLREKGVDHIVVTRPDGHLVGVFRFPAARGHTSA